MLRIEPENLITVDRLFKVTFSKSAPNFSAILKFTLAHGWKNENQ